jgi:SAM-dependent methyltransferase
MISDEPVFLDSVAALLLQVIDGRATVNDLVDDVHEVLGVEPTIARGEVLRSLDIFAAGGLLENAPISSRPPSMSDPFVSPASDQVQALARLNEMGAIDLAIGDHTTRVMCAEADALATLRRGLATCVVKRKAPTGFLLHVPSVRQRLYVVSDRSGHVLGRTRERDQALAILAGHLNALQSPRHGSVRMSARALIAPDGGAILASWPLLYAPPISEGQLERTGYRLLDRLWIDVNPSQGVLEHDETPWEALRSLDPGPGHLSSSAYPHHVRGLLLPGGPNTFTPTKAELVRYIAALAVAVQDRAQALMAADLLASTVEVRHVKLDDPRSLYEALKGFATNFDSTSSPAASPVPIDREASTSKSIEESYDELPYGSKAFVDSHPIQLSTTAEFCGLATTPVDRCRVLELGCGEGGNLIPVAEAYPESEFVGIDLSSHQIDMGSAAIAELGLTNVELRHLDLADVDHTLGRFDYIICHGVFSWVPGPIQSKILEVCRDNATLGGVSYISYNTFPGWHLRGMLRKAMLESVEEGSSLIDSVAAAREVLASMIYDVDTTSSYGNLLKGTAEAVLDESDSYIAHEFLAPINEPVYHRDFVDRAAAHGLRWLGDQRVVANPSLLGHSLISVDPSDSRRQEYNDIISNGTFRGAVLCRSDAPLAPESVTSRLQSFRVSTSLSAPKRLDLAQGVPAPFTGRDVRDRPITLESDSAVLKSALKQLSTVNGSVSLAELVALVTADLADRLPRTAGWDIPSMLTGDLQALRAVHANEAVEFLTGAYQFTREQSERPCVSLWARWEASRGTVATNRKNFQVDLGDPIRRFLVQRLDGSRTVDDLIAEAMRESERGALVIADGGGKPIRTGADYGLVVRSLVEAQLAFLARAAMLIA